MVNKSYSKLVRPKSSFQKRNYVKKHAVDVIVARKSGKYK